jgi:hypothetical protein
MSSLFSGFTFGPDPFVDRKVVRGHPVRAKFLLKFFPATLSVYQDKSIDRCDRIVLIVDDKSGSPILNDFWDGSLVVRNNWCVTGHRLD